jgi:MoxR-like ATPase
MAERSVNAFNREYRLPYLTVFADRNRVEKEETFEISAAARDRFMMEMLIESPEAPEVQRALAFDPVFHDTERLLERVAPEILAYAELGEIGRLIQEEIRASDALAQYALDLWNATRRPAAYGVSIDGIDMKELVLAGASPRGMSMLLRAARVVAWLKGHGHVVPEDIQAVYFETIAHRVFFNPMYELHRSQVARELIGGIMNRIAAP